MSLFPFYAGSYAIPSMGSVLEGVENQPWFGDWTQQVWLPSSISGAARDSGNTVTDVLRPGLLLGMVSSTGLLKEWNPTGTDGSQNIYGVLGAPLKMTTGGGDQDRYVGFVQIAGNLYSDRIIIPGNSTEGIVGDNLEFLVEALLSHRFRLDRHLQFNSGNGVWVAQRTISSGSPVTITTSLRNTLIDNSGASGSMTYNLPSPKRGLRFLFRRATAQNMVLDPGTGNSIVADGASASTYTLSVAQEFIEITGVSTTVYITTRHDKSEA